MWGSSKAVRAITIRTSIVVVMVILVKTLKAKAFVVAAVNVVVVFL